MDKALSLLIGAGLLLILGIAVASINSSSIDMFDQSSDDISNQGCRYQQGKVYFEGASEESLSDSCQNEDYEENKLQTETIIKLEEE